MPAKAIIEIVTKGTDKARRDIDQFQGSTSRLREQIEQLGKSARESSLGVAFVNSFQGASKAISNARDELQKFRNEAKDPITIDRVRNGFGDTSTGLSAASGALGTFSPEAGRVLQGASDVAGFAETIPTALQGIGALGLAAAPIAGATLAASAGLAVLNKELDQQSKAVEALSNIERDRVDALIATRNDLRTLTQSDARERIDALQFEVDAARASRDSLVDSYRQSIGEVKGFGDAVTTSISGLASRVGISVGSIGAAQAELKKWNEELAQNQAELDRLNNDVLPALQERSANQEVVDALREESQLRVQVAQLIRSGTSEQIKDRRALIDAEQAAAESAKATSDAQIAAFYEQNKGLLSIYDDYIARGGAEALQGQRLKDLLLSQVEPFEQASAELAGTLQALAAEEEALRTSAAPIVRLREEEEAAVKKLNDLMDERRSLLEKVAQAERAVDQAIAEEQRRRQLAEEKRALADKRRAEDDALNRREQALREADAEAQQRQQMVSLQNETNAQRISLEQKFFADSLKALTEFRKSEQRLDQDYFRARQRKLEDLNDSLLSAASSNDVSQFIALQKEAEKQLRRDQEDFGINKDRRLEDFTTGNEERRNALQSELTELINSYQERVATVTQGESTLNTALAQLQRERQALQLARQAEDNAIQQRIEDQAFQARLSDLQQKENLLTSEYANLNTQIALAGYQAGVAHARAFQAGVSSTSPSTNIPRGGSSGVRNGFTATAFATGGIQITDRPSVGIFSENYQKEAHIAIPIQSSRGFANDLRALMGQGGAGRPSVYVDARGASIEGLTEAQVDAKFEAWANQIADAIDAAEASL